MIPFSREKVETSIDWCVECPSTRSKTGRGIPLSSTCLLKRLATYEKKDLESIHPVSVAAKREFFGALFMYNPHACIDFPGTMNVGGRKSPAAFIVASTVICDLSVFLTSGTILDPFSANTLFPVLPPRANPLSSQLNILLPS